jgi:hypothetical protein
MQADNALLRAALLGYEVELDRIQRAIKDIQAELRQGAPGSGSPVEPGTRRFSAETRERMALAQRKRWAERKGASDASAPAPAKKRKMSAAGRKRIIEATKKRWAAYRAQKAKG